MTATATPLLTTLVLSGLAAFAQAGDFPPDAELRTLLDERVEAGRATGIVLGVLEADGTERVVAFGNPGEGAAPLDAESVFEIGSITKTFTGVLLAELTLRGEATLEQSILEYLPDYVRIPRGESQKIRLVDLATHRSGLPRLPHNLQPLDPHNPYADYTTQQLYDFLTNYRLPRPVGAEYEYSNLGAGLLGHALAHRVGLDYEALVTERILEPLGMTLTGISLTPELKRRLTRGHDDRGREVSGWDLPALAGAGALRSCARDMLRYLRANLGPPTTLLERAMQLSHEPRERAVGSDEIGLFWQTRQLGDTRIVWHSGGTGGFRSFVGFDPAARIGLVLLMNSTQGADDLAFHLLDEDFPLAAVTQAPARPVPVEVAREVLATYVGKYELAPDFLVEVTLESSGLFAQATDQPRLQLFAESETRFEVELVDAKIEFIREAGEVTALELTQDGATQRAKRL